MYIFIYIVKHLCFELRSWPQNIVKAGCPMVLKGVVWPTPASTIFWVYAQPWAQLAGKGLDQTIWVTSCAILSADTVHETIIHI